MPNLTSRALAEPESMDQLRGDCALMAPHWSSPFSFSTAAAAPAVAAVSHEALRGVRVPAASARLLEGMSEYGDW